MHQSTLDSYQRSVPAHRDPDVLKRLYFDEGMSTKAVAQELDVHPSTIRHWKGKHGIEKKAPTEKHRIGVLYRNRSDGFVQMVNTYKGKQYTVLLHQLVAIADGADPHKVFTNGKYYVLHKNGVRWDNRPSNVELVPPKTKPSERVERDSCYFCSSRDNIEAHHIVPQRFHGSDERENLVAVCNACHGKLESLYGPAFYQALGIDDEVGERKMHFPCKRPECDSRAETKLSGFRSGPIWVCKDCESNVPYRTEREVLDEVSH